MPIDLESTAGMGIRRSKMNQIISKLNELETALSGAGIVQSTWLKVAPSSGSPLLGMGPRIASITNGGSSLQVHFDPPFDSADDYAAVCCISNVSGNAAGNSFASLTAQATDSVTFAFNSDDGIAGTPDLADVIVTWSLTL